MLFTGLSKLGIVCAFINTNLRSKSLIHSIQVSKAKAIIVGQSKLSGFIISNNKQSNYQTHSLCITTFVF